MYVKIVASGKLIERYEYEKEPIPATLRKRRKKNRSYIRRRRINNAIKTRNNFFRLVRSNIGGQETPAFLTLTIAEVGTIEEGWRAFTLFSQRIRNKIPAFRCIAVPEFQKRGAVHFHALVWGLSDGACVQSNQFFYDRTGRKKRKHVCPETYFCERRSRRVATIWGNGYVDLFATDGSPKIASYLAKYMHKGMLDSRLSGKKAYSASRGIMRSVSLKSKTAVNTVERMLEGKDGGSGVDSPLTPVEEREYNTKWLGRCRYQQFNLE